MLADAGLTALISNRLFPSKRPDDGPLPVVVFNRISRPRPNHGNQFIRMQYDVYGSTYAEAQQVGDAVEAAAMNATSIEDLHTVYIDNSNDDFEQNKQYYRVIIDVIFYYLKNREYEQ